jgi:cytochrome c556
MSGNLSIKSRFEESFEGQRLLAERRDLMKNLHKIWDEQEEFETRLRKVFYRMKEQRNSQNSQLKKELEANMKGIPTDC